VKGDARGCRLWKGSGILDRRAGEREWGESWAAVQVRVVDPRSTTWELDAPVFRVTFFRHDPAYADVPSEFVGYVNRDRLPRPDYWMRVTGQG
jgi:hypothetical protein